MNRITDGLHKTGLSRRRFLEGALVAPAALSLGIGGRAAAQSNPGQLVIGHTTLRHLNPAIQSGQATGLPGTQIFAGLVRIDENFEPQPYLADSWEIAKDGLSYTFNLNTKANFHDGKPVTSADVAFSIATVKANHPFGEIMFGPVKEVKTPDDHTAEIILDRPQPAMMQALHPLLMPVLPQHIYGEGDIQSNPANIQAVGAGPFKYKDYRAGEYLILEKNDDYFMDEGPYLDRLVLRVSQDPLVNVLGLERGEIDYLSFALVRITEIDRLRQNEDLVVTRDGYEAFGATNYLEFNLRVAPLNDVRVRHAIAYAIDKSFIIDKLLRGEAKRLDGPLTASNPFASKDLNVYNVDIERATTLLDEAGYNPDASGTRLTLTLEWLPDANINSQEPVANYLKAQLSKIGIKIELRPNADFASYAARVANWEHQLLLNGMWNYPDPVIGVHRAYVSSNIKHQIYTNTSGYSNPEVDKVLADAAVEPNFDKRKELYAKFQDIVTEDLPLCWTNEEPFFTIHRKGLVNPPLTVWGPLAPYDRVRWS